MAVHLREFPLRWKKVPPSGPMRRLAKSTKEKSWQLQNDQVKVESIESVTIAEIMVESKNCPNTFLEEANPAKSCNKIAVSSVPE